MTKKRLLVATDCFLPRLDGIAVFLRELIPHLAEHFEITVVAPDFTGESPDLPAEVFRVPLGGTVADLPVARLSYRRIKDLVRDADVVFNNTVGTVGACALRASRALGKPAVSFVHSYEWELFSLSVRRLRPLVRWVTKAFMRRVYRWPSLLLFPSEEARDAFKRIGIERPAEVVPIGIALDRFKPKRKPHKTWTVGYCGRLAREKGLDCLLTAFARLEKRQEARLLLVGDGLRSIKRRAKRMGARITGQVEDPQRYYARMDVFVLPSLTETTSLSVMEAMASGLPVVATPVGRVPGYLKESGGGVVVPKEDPHAIEIAVEHILTDPSLAKRYGKNARKYALEHFDIKKSARSLARILDEQAGGKRG